MKRRDLILASAGMLVPALGRSAQPCPPPQVSVSGGSTASTPCGTNVSGQSYSTNFAGTENPLSEGGVWINGSITGYRSDCASQPGRGYGTQVPITPPPYSDSWAILNLPFSPDVYSKAVVYVDPSISGEHELELLLRASMSSGRSYGYAFDWVYNSGNIYMGTADGADGAFSQWGAPFPVAFRTPRNGDVIEFQLKGWIATCWINGSQIFQHDVSKHSITYSSGRPGIAFYSDRSYGTPTSGNTLCYSHYECRDI
jgi:hypothetical protein